MKSAIDVPKKASRTSLLKNLSDARQADILEHYETHKGTDTVRWLATTGINTSVPSLSEWRKWYLERSLFDREAKSITCSLAAFHRLNPHITKQDLNRLGEMVFNALAIKRRDIKTWNLAQQIQLKRERQVQQQQMVDIAKKRQALEAKKYKDQKPKPARRSRKKKLTPAQRQARIRQVFGIS